MMSLSFYLYQGLLYFLKVPFLTSNWNFEVYNGFEKKKILHQANCITFGVIFQATKNITGEELRISMVSLEIFALWKSLFYTPIAQENPKDWDSYMMQVFYGTNQVEHDFGEKEDQEVMDQVDTIGVRQGRNHRLQAILPPP